MLCRQLLVRSSRAIYSPLKAVTIQNYTTATPPPFENSNAVSEDSANKPAQTPHFASMLKVPGNNKPLDNKFTGFIGTGNDAGRMRPDEQENEDPMHKLILHVHASSNNTILSLTDANGRVLVNASGGTVGFKKAQRAGFEAAYQATVSIATAVKERAIQVRKVELRLKGFGAGRDAAFKAVNGVTNWPICQVVDTTPIPFNGCRPKKARRL